MKWEERLRAQMPQNKLASAGMMCTYCDLGPCVINPFDDEPQVGACGIDAENMNMVNLALSVVKGLQDYGVPGNIYLSLDAMKGPAHTTGITVPSLLEASRPLLKASEERVSTWHFDERKPREIDYGVGVLQQDAVNIVLTTYEPEMIKTSKSQKMRKLAKDNGAQKINLVGALCGGAEAAYNYGVPLLGGIVQLEEAHDMIDYLYDGGDGARACEQAVENFSSRDKALFKHVTPTRFSVGYPIDKETINAAIEKGVINGVVALIGCPIGKSTWDTDELVQTLSENDFLVINLSCDLKNSELGTKSSSLLTDYGLPAVLNGGCCEPGKIMGLNKLTVAMPTWRDPRLLTAALAIASEGIPVILGTMPFVTPRVRNQLVEAGITIEAHSSQVMDLLR
jgi:hydroxylamine reductase (hybrid-cluster protein)